jgi:pantoate--beta-alanine ligase
LHLLASLPGQIRYHIRDFIIVRWLYALKAYFCKNFTIMIIINTAIELQKQLSKSHLAPVGFVPTMGALHEGHLSLVSSAVIQCSVVVVSIFVNPTQFNDKNDLLNYPRTPKSDLRLLNGVMRESDLVFIPDVKEIYPFEDKRLFHFGNLDKVMEALHRPGHFNGVAQVVSRLFEIVNPDIAFFGLKDFQQLAVIKELVRQTKNKVRVIGNPIIRESDGLAMSSRNVLLDPQIRSHASSIYKSISEASRMISDHDIPEIRNAVAENINSISGFKLEYFEIVDDTELIPVTTKDEMKKGKRYFGCIAVTAGKIRLIDNIEIGLF